MSKSRITIDTRLAEGFNNYMKGYLKLYQDLARVVKNHIVESTKGNIIVDLGAGTCYFSKELKKQLPDAFIINIEPSKEMIKTALKNIEDNEKSSINLIRAKTEYTPLKSNVADIIVTRFTIPYWDMIDTGLKETRRILKNRGVLIIEELNPDYPKWKLWLMKLHMHLRGADKRLVEYQDEAYRIAYRIEELEGLLKTNHYNVIKKEYKKNRWRYLLIAEKKE